jgi:hypothetical protein
MGPFDELPISTVERCPEAGEKNRMSSNAVPVTSGQRFFVGFAEKQRQSRRNSRFLGKSGWGKIAVNLDKSWRKRLTGQKNTFSVDKW